MLKSWERLGDFLIFAALLVISIVTMLSRNEPMVRGLRAASLELSGVVEGTFAIAGRYLRALNENEMLLEENIRLSGELARSREALLENDRLRAMLGYADSLSFRRVAARTVYKDITRERNTFTIDAGSIEGVAVDMAVVEPRGIVGKIVLVSPRYSQVMTFQNTDFFLPVRIQPHLSDGILRWSGEYRDMLEVDHVMKTAQVARGQLVVSSGYSAIFPPGIPIGTVDSVMSPPGQPSWRILVRPLASLGDVEHVFVLTERPAPERLKLADPRE